MFTIRAKFEQQLYEFRRVDNKAAPDRTVDGSVARRVLPVWIRSMLKQDSCDTVVELPPSPPDPTRAYRTEFGQQRRHARNRKIADAG